MKTTDFSNNAPPPIPQPTFEQELTQLIHKFGLEKESDTPDYILAQHLVHCLDTYNTTCKKKREWYSAPDHTFNVVSKKIQ